MNRIAFLHRALGVVTVLVFLWTGKYMFGILGPPDPATHLTRMLYRSAHVYLLLSGLINIALGVYLLPAGSQLRRRIQMVASILILIAPALELWAFFHEPPVASVERPLTLSAMIALLTGTTLHLLVGRGQVRAARLH